jgi:hypothetical protein
MSETNSFEVTTVGILRLQVEQAYADLIESLKDLTDGEALALPLTDGRADLYCGPVLGIIHHLAACKLMYAGAAFRGGAITWQECFTWIESLVIHTITQHDAYHSGQIVAFRSMLTPAG